MSEKKPKAEAKPKATKEKPAEKAKAPEIMEFEPRKIYKIEALAGDKHLKPGAIYEVSGEIAGILIKKGTAKLA